MKARNFEALTSREITALREKHGDLIGDVPKIYAQKPWMKYILPKQTVLDQLKRIEKTLNAVAEKPDATRAAALHDEYELFRRRNRRLQKEVLFDKKIEEIKKMLREAVKKTPEMQAKIRKLGEIDFSKVRMTKSAYEEYAKMIEKRITGRFFEYYGGVQLVKKGGHWYVELVFSGNEFFKFSAPDLLQPLVAGNSNAMIHSHQDHDPELSDWDLETSKRYRTPVIMIVTGGKKPSIKMGANGKKFAVELVE